jgi:hypothetical protein
MDLSIFVAGRDNEIPEPRERRGLFWEWTAGMLSLPDASATVPLRFQGLGANRYDVNWQIDAVARRDEKIRRLNLPPTKGEVVAGIVGDVVEAVKAKLRKPTKTAAAAEWLATVLQHGPVPQKDIEAMAKKEGISSKPLKLAKGRLKVKSTRKGRSSWAWMLPFKKAADVEGH